MNLNYHGKLPCYILRLRIQFLTNCQMDQEELGHHHPEACNIVGSMTNFLHPNIQPSGSASGLNIHYAQQQYNNAIFYGMMPYNGVEHHPAANFYHPYMTPAPGNPKLSASYFGSEPSTFYTRQGVIGIPVNEYGRSTHPMDANRACKRKDAEGIQRKFHLHSASEGPSSSIATSNTRQFEPRDGMMDSEFFVPTHNRPNEPSSSLDVGSRRTAQDSVVAHNQSFLLPESYISKPGHSAGSPWLEQQIVNSCVDGATSSWMHAHVAPYLYGSNVNGGSRATGIMGMPGYNETNGNCSANLMPPMQHRHHNVHRPTPPPLLQGPRNPNLSLYPPVPPAPFAVRPNNMARVNNNALQDVTNVGPRHLIPSRLRMYRSHHDCEAAAEASLRPHHFPYLRVLPTDEVAILEFTGYYEAVNAVDHHQDMRLDIEDMSYEELLALGERIGNVNTGLSEETIRRHLQTRIHVSSTIPINLEESAYEEEETESCIICQSEYMDQEKVGILHCGHEYHADCLKKWLLVKNVCPICKSPSLSTEKKNS